MRSPPDFIRQGPFTGSATLVPMREAVFRFQVSYIEWNEVVMGFMNRHAYGPLVAFCGTCCAEVFAAAGDAEGAERELTNALRTLQAKSESLRCTHPAAKLAEIRNERGRVQNLLEVVKDEKEAAVA